MPAQVEAWMTGSEGPPPPRPDLLWYRLTDDLFRQLDSAGTHAAALARPGAGAARLVGRRPLAGGLHAYSSRFRTRRTSAR